MVHGYGEWIRHPLFGLRSRSLVGVYKQKQKERKVRETTFSRPLWQIERKAASFGGQRGVSPPKPSLTEGQKRYSARFVVYLASTFRNRDTSFEIAPVKSHVSFQNSFKILQRLIDIFKQLIFTKCFRKKICFRISLLRVITNCTIAYSIAWSIIKNNLGQGWFRMRIKVEMLRKVPVDIVANNGRSDMGMTMAGGQNAR